MHKTLTGIEEPLLCTYYYAEFSLCLLKGVGEGCVLGGVTNHIKALKPHLLKRSKESSCRKHLKYTGENTVMHIIIDIHFSLSVDFVEVDSTASSPDPLPSFSMFACNIVRL